MQAPALKLSVQDNFNAGYDHYGIKLIRRSVYNMKAWSISTQHFLILKSVKLDDLTLERYLLNKEAFYFCKINSLKFLLYEVLQRNI